MEVEIKLLIDPGAIADLVAHPAFAAAPPPKKRHLSTTYFDTPDFALWRSGVSLRVRKSAAGFVQTVKSNEAGQAIGARGEWEWPVATGKPDLDLIVSLPRELQQHFAVAGRTGPLFTTSIDRQTWRLELEPSTVIEAALDIGSVRAGKRDAAIAEVELELKAGSAAPLLRLAMDLVGRYALRYGSQSKSDRGYALLTDDLPPRHSHDQVVLPRDVSVADAFPRLLNGVLRGFAAEAPLAERGDVEGVHRMRAAIRRSRSLLVLFGPDLDPRAAERFNASLRDIGQVLGRSRDWDVFLTETLPAAHRELDAGLLDALDRDAAAAQAQAHAAVGTMMRGEAATQLLLGLAAWVADPRWFIGPDRDRALRERLPTMLKRLERKVRRRCKELDHDDAAALHGLRKSLKKLRYSIEMTASLYTAREVAAYLETIKSTLSVLGRANDATVAAARTNDLAPLGRPELAAAGAALLDWTDRRRAKAMHKLAKPLHHLKHLDPFWS